MTDISFGSMLRNARNQQGYDVNFVARRLRIRPDILEAIESGDFERMPPRGYSRNMVNAYARFLGLNSTEVTHKYLNDFYAYQVHEARSRNTHLGRGFDMPNNTRSTRAVLPGERQRSATQKQQQQSNALGRTLYTTEQDHSDNGTQRHSQGRSRGLTESRTHRASRGALPSSQYTNFYSGPKATSRVSSKLPFIIAGVVIAVLLIIILVLVFGPKGSSGSSGNNIPVNGVSEVGVPSDTLSDENTATQNTVTKKAPVDFTFSFKVADGGDAWCEVYVDGAVQIAETISGPIEKSYRSAGKIRFITANPDVVTLYVDGAQMTPEVSDGGIVDVTYDFADILAQWNAANPTTTSNNSSSSNNASGSNTTG